MSVPPAFDLQGLLAEDQWVRRLARSLAGPTGVMARPGRPA